MYKCFLDAMAIVRETGAPNLFTAMMCNPKWPEIKEHLRPGEKASDRPDIVAREFMQKLKTLNKDLDVGLLGVVAARVHVVEYQKRGLPHAHKPVTAEDVDRLTSAELPDKETHPELYETFAEETIMAEDKYPTYKRRRQPEGVLSHNGKVWDNAKINQWVVPYNPFLSQKYDCHINVEVCATNKAVKYIYKYVYNGSDMTTITIEGEEIQANEILRYLLGRYISPVEACMRLFGFPTHGSSHAVVNLTIHLEGMSLVTYRDHATTTQLQNLVRRGDRTKLTAFFNLCTQYPEGTAAFLYKDVPVMYRWDDRLKYWVPYKNTLLRWIDWYTSRHKTQSGFTLDFYCAIGDHPNLGNEWSGLRYLSRRSTDCWNDQEWEEFLAEAVSFKMPSTLRELLGIILVYSQPDYASALCDRFKKDLTEDFFRSIQERDSQNNIDRDEDVSWRMAEYKCLMWLADYLISNGKHDVSDEIARQSADPMDIVAQEVAAYEPDDLERTATLADQMNENQKDFLTKSSKLGTGKSFLLEQILAHVRLQRKVAIAVASSGIAATLLTGGLTAHSTFRIPLKLA
ncbi:Helitron helicase-like protein [Phytophthora palmivora]|uniref:ATP-dependent DNA helicase n=1 Tax=Phytophthora palmivora TaxID=4796 RepID=A0A2P4X955_9STRA|nr:Helitron helicase-like protein [Phytophthora palmivora]